MNEVEKWQYIQAVVRHDDSTTAVQARRMGAAIEIIDNATELAEYCMVKLDKIDRVMDKFVSENPRLAVMAASIQATHFVGTRKQFANYLYVDL
jgi:hypothetical protein